DGHAAAQRLLEMADRPTAVFAANDDLALGAMRAFHTAGLRIPQDIAVVGYDDVANTAFYEPPLTTVRQPFDDLGRHALEALVAASAGGQPEAGLRARELGVRESSVGSAAG